MVEVFGEITVGRTADAALTLVCSLPVSSYLEKASVWAIERLGF